MSDAATAPTPARNRAETERRLRGAVERLLVAGGFGALGPSAVAREAGVDKMLIYRYFGDLPGLVRAVADGPDFFPSLEELCGGDVAATRALALPERVSTVLRAYVETLARRPVVLELMAWEMVERNALTALAETPREALGGRIGRELFDDVPLEGPGRAVQAVLAAAVSYLLLRRRKIRTFNGLDLRSDADWEPVFQAAEAMARGLALPSHAGSA